jgi:hypothetical protein
LSCAPKSRSSRTREYARPNHFSANSKHRFSLSVRDSKGTSPVSIETIHLKGMSPRRLGSTPRLRSSCSTSLSSLFFFSFLSCDRKIVSRQITALKATLGSRYCLTALLRVFLRSLCFRVNILFKTEWHKRCIRFYHEFFQLLHESVDVRGEKRSWTA